jgi:ribosomal protein S3
VNGKEVEVGPGFVAGEGGATISIKRVNRERIYRVGEKIEIDATQFQEIAFACHLFAEDIASKLHTS